MGKCETCRFADITIVTRSDTEERPYRLTDVLCRRYPVKRHVNLFHWCGEYQPKESANE